MSEVTSQIYQEKKNVTYLLGLIFLLIVLDVTIDIFEGMPIEGLFFDFLLEGTILAVVIFTAQYIWRKFKNEAQHKQQFASDLEKTRELANQWERKSKEFIKEYQAFVLLQFEKWNLSKSEREVALLLLKGKSSKDIAEIRFTSDRTIRNQCRSIYEKSGLGGKGELSAFFLNELIVDI